MTTAELLAENERLRVALAAALEQQTATSEILRVISSSPTDVQPVFDTIIKNAVRLCDGLFGAVFRVEDGLLVPVAYYNFTLEALEEMRRTYPTPPATAGLLGRAVLDRSVAKSDDVEHDPRTSNPRLARVLGYRAFLAVPMMRAGVPIGAIGLARADQPFTDRESLLVETFADQAVIAIDNARLFNETKEALERQTATSEILCVISRSPTDVQPVFNEVAQSAARLCQAQFCHVFRFDGALLHLAAHHGLSPEGVAALQSVYPSAPGRASAAGRSILSGRIEQIPDINADADYRHSRIAALMNYQSIVAVPMLRDGMPIGSIVAGRSNTGFFPERLVTLLQTFADQAVIAIENVRLFKELEARNSELTEALEQQTATSEILRVISRSQTDVQPVFDAIVASAARLLRGYFGALTRLVGDQIELAATTFTTSTEDPAVRAAFPHSLHAEGTTHAQAIRDRTPVNIADAQTDPTLSEARRAVARARGYRSLTTVPLLRQGEALGTITVARREAGGFADDEIALLQTFADQAVIAIENVRLFKELEARNSELTEALTQQTATSDILRIISRSPTDVRPVLDAVAESAARLCEAFDASVHRVGGNRLRLVAHHGPNPSGIIGEFALPLVRGTVVGRSALEERTVQVADLQAEPDELPEGSELARQIGVFRTILAVPLMREGVAIGTISLRRTEVQLFTERQVGLLQTFADQAVIAIENVRLFKELEARTGELTRSVKELKALGEVGQAVSSSLDLETVLTTIVSRAVQLSGLDGGTVFEYNEASEEFVQRATTGSARVLAGRAVVRKGEGVVGRTAVTFEPVEVSDIRVGGAYESRLREALVEAGVRAIIAVPIIREGRLLGGFAVNRNAPGEFPPETVELLRTFATQSALAIQNARLFREIEDKSRQLEAASRHKSEFLANMSHELRTPLNAIIGFSEVLTERMFGELNEKQEEYLRDIYASGQHLLSLINDILDLSKIEAGRMELEPAEFDLPSAIENALILVRERAGRRGIALGRSVDERLGVIRADERKVKQVLLNLLSNALKFTPEGGRIDVRATVNDGEAEISVTDTGVGIAPEDQEAIFEEFRQVGTADKKVEGTGLGLALSRKFIELHGGRISAKSQVGQGSTFTFTMPLRR